MDQLPIAVKFVAAFAVVMALIISSAWALRRLSEDARRRFAAKAATKAPPQPFAVEPNWALISASVAITHGLVLVFASKPGISDGIKFLVAIVCAAGLMLILRRHFGRS
jgi:hypothetical protein